MVRRGELCGAFDENRLVKVDEPLTNCNNRQLLPPQPSELTEQNFRE